jgi:hypothetical protein
MTGAESMTSAEELLELAARLSEAGKKIDVEAIRKTTSTQH